MKLKEKMGGMRHGDLGADTNLDERSTKMIHGPPGDLSLVVMAEATDRHQASVIRYWCDELRGLTLNTLPPQDDLWNRLLEDYAPSTSRWMLGILNHIFTLRFGDDNPLDLSRVKIPKREPKVKTQDGPISPASLGNHIPGLLKACQSESRDLHDWVALLAATGARREEIPPIPGEDVSPHGDEQAIIFIRQSKNKVERHVRLGGSIARIALRRAQESAGAPIFPAKRGRCGGTLSWPYRAWCRAREKVGLPGLTPHHLRHWYASEAARLFSSPDQVAKMIGDLTTDMAGRYTHLSETEEAQGQVTIQKKLEAVC